MRFPGRRFAAQMMGAVAPAAPTLTVADWGEWLQGYSQSLTATHTDPTVTVHYFATPYGGGAETDLGNAATPFTVSYTNALTAGRYTLVARATKGGLWSVDSASVNVYSHRSSTVTHYEHLAANVTKDGGNRVSAHACLVTGDANKDYAQANGSFQPLWTASDADFNARPSLTYDETRHDRLRTGVWGTPLPAICTRLVVGKQTANTSGYRMVVDGITAANRTALFTNTGDAHTGMANATGSVIAGTANGTTPFVKVGVFNGASSKIYRSAHTAIASGDTGAGNTMTGSTLGADQGETVWWDGKSALVLDDNTALSASAVADLLDWYGAKFGIAIGA